MLNPCESVSQSVLQNQSDMSQSPTIPPQNFPLLQYIPSSSPVSNNQMAICDLSPPRIEVGELIKLDNLHCNLGHLGGQSDTLRSFLSWQFQMQNWISQSMGKIAGLRNSEVQLQVENMELGQVVHQLANLYPNLKKQNDDNLAVFWQHMVNQWTEISGLFQQVSQSQDVQSSALSQVCVDLYQVKVAVSDGILQKIPALTNQVNDKLLQLANKCQLAFGHTSNQLQTLQHSLQQTMELLAVQKHFC